MARFISFLSALAFGALLAGCGDQKPSAQQGPPPAPQVTVAKPTKRLVADHDEFVGRFMAVDFVEIRARVSGYLESVHFKDGQLVQSGDPLFTIDRRTFQASLDQAKAALAQSKANLAFAQSDLARVKSLTPGMSVSQQTVEQRLQGQRVAEASVAAQEAAVRQAELDLSFTDLRAPVSGRIGDARVTIGNLVTGGSGGGTTLLATIQSLDPIRFEFTMDEASYLRYVNAASQAGEEMANRGMSLPVKLKLLDERDFMHEGRVEFVDNAVDQSSGTIRVRALFPNKDGKLTPGMFGRIQLTPRAPEEALTVPDAAIGTEQVRKFVYVVNAENVAQPKYVTLGPLVDGLRVIKTGLEPDDTVVVNGLMRVRPGAKVAPQVAAAPESPQAANSPAK